MTAPSINVIFAGLGDILLNVARATEAMVRANALVSFNMPTNETMNSATNPQSSM